MTRLLACAWFVVAVLLGACGGEIVEPTEPSETAEAAGSGSTAPPLRTFTRQWRTCAAPLDCADAFINYPSECWTGSDAADMDHRCVMQCGPEVYTAIGCSRDFGGVCERLDDSDRLFCVPPPLSR
jgi:hypothetical protein